MVATTLTTHPDSVFPPVSSVVVFLGGDHPLRQALKAAFDPDTFGVFFIQTGELNNWRTRCTQNIIGI
jgi:hypothetical protein